jgi:adenosylcobinamide kinase/adenosylcobinamide-phosphate guanylyltransferase
VTFIATAQALDDEMSARIQKHRAERPATWETLEIQFDIASQLHRVKSKVVLLDCITLLISNLLMQFVKDDLVEEAPFMAAVQDEIDELMRRLRIVEQEQDWILISNEVGLGLVPPYQMGRVYRDAIGWANQRLAREADKVIFMVAGIPTTIK